MPSSMRKYIAAGLLAAGSAAVTVYAVRRRRDKAVDKELAGLLDEVEIPPVKPSPEADVPALSGARSDQVRSDANATFQDLMAAKPAAEAKPNPAASA